jgi:hypothetical protein
MGPFSHKIAKKTSSPMGRARRLGGELSPETVLPGFAEQVPLMGHVQALHPSGEAPFVPDCSTGPFDGTEIAVPKNGGVSAPTQKHGCSDGFTGHLG